METFENPTSAQVLIKKTINNEYALYKKTHLSRSDAGKKEVNERKQGGA